MGRAKLEVESLLGRNDSAKGESEMACSAQRTTGLEWGHHQANTFEHLATDNQGPAVSD